MPILLASLVVTALTLAIAVGLGRFTGIRAHRQRDAEWAAALRASCNSSPPADPSKIVELVLEHGASCRAWHMPDIGWVDADDLALIVEPVVGWRELRKADVDFAPPLKELADELKRRGFAPYG